MVKKKKVVLVSSGALTVPPAGYGGLEQVVYDLAYGLDKMGHEVFIIAPQGSTPPPGSNCRILEGLAGPNPDARGWEFDSFQKYRPMMDSEELKDAVWHDHTWGKFIYAAKQQNPKLNVCSTLHGMLCYHTPPPVKKPSIIGISKSHADSISAGLGIPVRFVYNGIDLGKYQMGDDSKRTDRYLFLARMTAFKGAHTFVDLMRQLQLKGDLVGDDTMVEDKQYVERLLLACNDYPSVRYWGGVPRSMAVKFFQRAKLYLLPCNPGWEEPFGLSVIESMACGTPVIATPSGALKELVDESSGVIVKSLQDLPEAVKSFDFSKVTAKSCRARAEQFSRERMAEGYDKLYDEVLERGGW